MDSAALLYVAPLVALIGMYLCLPDQPRAFRAFGSLVSLAGVLAALYALVDYFGLPVFHRVTVPAVGLVALMSGRMVIHRSPVYAALYFGGVVVLTAALVLMAGAHFLAAILVIVYAGAILVAYVFVIMLAQEPRPAAFDLVFRQPVLALTTGAALIVAAVMVVLRSSTGVVRPDAQPLPLTAAASGSGGNVVDVGMILFGRYPIAIEVAGVFLLIAMVGAIVLARLSAAPDNQKVVE